MEAVGERDDVATAGDLAGQLHRGFDGVGASRAGHHDLVVHATRLENFLLIGRQERRLGVGVHVQTMGYPVGGDVVDQRRFHVGVVVAVVQRRTAGQEVDIRVAVGVGHFRPLGFHEGGGERTAVGACGALAAFIDVKIVGHVFRHFISPFGTKPTGSGKFRCRSQLVN
jgi:hypothetical protein